VPLGSISDRCSRERMAWIVARRSAHLVLAVVCGWAAGAPAQDASSKKAPDSPEVRSRAKGIVDPSSSARRLPDALKFANGLLRQKKYDLAAEEFERFANSGARGSDLDDARFGLANARLYQGNFRESWQAFDSFLKGAPEDPRRLTARYRLGELAYLLGNLAEARRSLEEFTAATSDHPGLEMALTYLGDACFGLQDLPHARAAYQRSLAAHPQGMLAERAKYGLGRTLAAQGERAQALTMMQELTRQANPEWVDRAWLQIGLIRKSAGQFAEAVDAFTTLERVAARSPLQPEARLQRALALARLARTAEAEKLLKPLAADGSVSQGSRAALELATIEVERNHPDAALSLLESSLKRFPDSPLLPALHFRAAEVLQKQNRLEEAQARFERVVESNPNDPWADDAQQRAAEAALDRGDLAGARRLAGTFGTMFPKSPLNPEVRLIESRAAAKQGKHQEAVAMLKLLLGPPADAASKPVPVLTPALNQAARYELALAYWALDQSALADPILAGLAKEGHADAQFLIGQSRLTAGRYGDAVPPLEAYLAANPKGDVADFALAHLAAARLGLGQVDDAWKTVANLSERFPRSRSLAPTRLRLAEAALAAHQTERAAEQFRLVAGDATSSREPRKLAESKSNEPTEPSLRIRALTGLGRCLRELGKPADAAAAFAAVLEMDPDNPAAPEVAVARARALEANKQVDAALKAYSLVMERFAKSDQAPHAALAQARLFAQAGRRDLAARAFARLIDDQDAQEALKSAGVTPDTLMSEWGWVLLDADKPAEADRVFGRLLKEHPNSPHAADARFNLAESANLARNYTEVVRLLTPLAATKPVGPKAEGQANEANVKTAAQAGTDSFWRLLPAALYRLGRTQAEMKDWAAAGVTLDRLLTEFPDSPYRRDAQYLRAESALRNGDVSTAEKGFAALLAEPAGANDPSGMVPAVRLKRIQCWIASKRWKDALEGAQAEKGGRPAGDPSLAELDYLTGQALLGLGQIENARAAFQAVIDVRKEGELAAQAQLMRGETYFHQDQFHEALRDFLKVDILHHAPRWQAAALLEAGKVYERLDQWADAAETYEGLLSRFPTAQCAPEARRRLDAATRRSALKDNRAKG
jgi:cellulose synthase operon protein C